MSGRLERILGPTRLRVSLDAIDPSCRSADNRKNRCDWLCRGYNQNVESESDAQTVHPLG